MEKVLKVTKKDRVEDKDWVESKKMRKEAEAGKAPPAEKGVDPAVEWEEKNRADAPDTDLDKPVHAIDPNKIKK